LSIQDTDKLSFIDSTTAKDIDDKLMSDLGFKLEQLMELAGIS
jgi:NAD(P)H-hydrate repair Nnr-like enzyme with NAD(P)H-hydrate epimerase domain